MRIVFLGTGDFGGPTLRTIVDVGHAVVAAVSQPDRPAGRGRKLRPTHIHSLADELRIRHMQPEDINEANLADLLGGAELGVVAAFGQKIGNGILDALPYGCINLHGSLLPKYRGAAPFQWAIINGDETTGVSVFQLDEKWDAGPIWGKRELRIRETETAAELHDRLASLGAELVTDTLSAIEQGRAQPVTQDPSLATRAPKLSRRDSRIDWSASAFEITRRINGLWSWPVATCMLALPNRAPERLQLARASVADSDAEPSPALPPGAFRPDRTVQSGRGCVRLLEVRPAGGKLMPLDAFACGRDLQPPARLLPLEQS